MSKTRRRLATPSVKPKPLPHAPGGTSPLADLFIMYEMKAWGLDDHQRALPLASPAFRAVMRAYRGDSPCDATMNLVKIWEAMGSPDGFNPASYFAGEGYVEEGETVDDRGPDGVWSGYGTATWYAQGLDPERITIDDACELLY